MKKTERKVLVSAMAVCVIAFVSLCIFVIYKNVEADNYSDANTRSISKVETVPTVEGLLDFTNKERLKAKVGVLEIDPRLNTSAQAKADDMAKNDYFGHTNPKTGFYGPQYAADATNQDCKYVSENLRLNTLGSNTSNDSVQGWMKSDTHRLAMLDSKYTYVGFGISGSYVVQHLCQR